MLPLALQIILNAVSGDCSTTPAEIKRSLEGLLSPEVVELGLDSLLTQGFLRNCSNHRNRRYLIRVRPEGFN